jgi:hypothetical protein
MISKILNVPSFLVSELRGEYTSIEQLIKSEMEFNVDAFDSQFDEIKDAIFLCVREKQKDGDYRLCLAAIPTNYSGDIINVALDGFSNMATIVINNKNDVAKVIEKVLENKAFI